jgi:hypothetical protein
MCPPQNLSYTRSQEQLQARHSTPPHIHQNKKSKEEQQQLAHTYALLMHKFNSLLSESAK